MTKQEFIRLMNIAGDACITLVSANSSRTRYTVGTTDLTTKYIQDKLSRVSNLVLTEDTVLLFCWDTDSFRTIDPARVIRIEPLNELIPNSV